MAHRQEDVALNAMTRRDVVRAQLGSCKMDVVHLRICRPRPAALLSLAQPRSNGLPSEAKPFCHAKGSRSLAHQQRCVIKLTCHRRDA